jgi:GNAT superfamily N-acetyltransferase
MIIRPATLNDVEDIANILEIHYKDCHQQRKVFEYNRKVLVNSLYNWIRCPTCFSLVAVDNGKVVGLLICFISNNYYSLDKISNVELFYVSPKNRSLKLANRMMKIYFEWCKALNVRNIEFAYTSAIDDVRIDSYLKRKGFKNFGNFYNKEII